MEFKATDVKSGSHRGCICGKHVRVHEVPSRSTFGCHKCGKEGNYTKDCYEQVPAPTPRICYNFEHIGNVKATYPFLTGGTDVGYRGNYFVDH